MKIQISCLPVSLYPEFFSGERTVAEWSKQAKEMGLDSVDINALFLRGKSIEEIQQIRAELTVPVYMVSAYSDFTLASKEEREEALKTAMEDMKRASAIGARYIRLTAGQAYPGEKDEDMIQRVKECFVACVGVAKELGLEILLENHSQPGAWKYPDFDFHMDRFLTLWDELKELPISVNFDTANAYALKDWKRLLNAVTGRIATIHLNDLASVEPLAFARVGEGIVPLEEMVRAVYAT
jgi:sugar phosphate isomerase/epimerase